MADEPAKMGRPTKLTPELQERLVQMLREGVTRQGAAAACRIGYATLAEWVARGESRDPERPPLPEFAEFAEALRAAEGDYERSLILEVSTYAGGGERPDWKGPAWLLERRFPDRWGKTVKQEVSGSLGLTHDLKTMTDEELQALADGTTPPSRPGSSGGG